MSGVDNQSTSKYSIFEQAQVSLSSDFMSLIPASVDQTSFFIDIAEELQLTFCEQIDNGCLVFLGMWNNILKAEKMLQEFLRLWEEERAIVEDNSSKEGTVTTESLGEVSILIPEGYVPSVLPGSPHVYLLPSNSSQLQKAQLLSCKLSPDESRQKSTSKTIEDSVINEIHVDIAIDSTENNQDCQDENSKTLSEEDQNPLDKLCQLLCIDEDETMKKSLSLAEKRRRYEEKLPFKFFCDKCSFKAKRENHLIKHLKLHDKKNVVFRCEECDFKTICERSLIRHKVIHSNTKLTCKLCPFVTDTRSSLQKHTQAKHGPNYAKTVKCRHCDFIATKPREMLRHLKLSHPKLELKRMWKCSKCPYTSKLRAHLNRHVNDVHVGTRKFLCHYCGKDFKRNDTLTAHKAVHGEASQTYECPHCDKVFVKPVHLQQHLAKHSSERPFLCDICGKSYKTLQATRRHKRFMHAENVKLFPCPRNCERTFKYRSHLSNHLKQPCKKTQSRLPVELTQDPVNRLPKAASQVRNNRLPKAPTLVPVNRLPKARTQVCVCRPPETTQVPEMISGSFVQEEVVTTPITIQVIHTDQLSANSLNVNNK